MKRTELIGKLIKEGFSEKTLVNFSDNQLKQLASRMLGEQDGTDEDVMVSKKDPQYQQKVADAKKQNKTIETYEELKGNQTKIDKNHNGKIDADDFAILNKEKKSDVNEADMGLTVKGSKSSSSNVFGSKPKTTKKSTPKKKEEKTEEGEVDESLHGIMIGATKEKLKKDLGRDPKDHEVEEELEKFVNDWKKEKGSKEEGGEKKEKEVDELLRFYDDDGNPIKDKKGKQDAVSTKDKKFGEKTKSKKCPDCGEHEKDCKCDYKHMDESKPSAGLSKEKKSEVVKKAKKGGDIGKKGKGFEKIADKATKKYGSKEAGQKVAAASMWKNIQREENEVKNWVKGLVENKEFHSFTSKNEIMELIQTKLNESETMIQHGPKVKKGHNGIPEFMTYDAITDAEPKTAPSKPAPTTKPGTKPTPTRREDPRKTPFQPGPGPNPKPKAKIAEEKKK